MLKKIPEEVMLMMAYLLKGIEGIGDLDIRFALSRASEYICNYCNINSVPKEVYNTWCDMALDILKDQFPTSFITDDGDGDISLENVSAVKVGDTNISVGNTEKNKAEAEVEKTISLENKMITTYATQLHKVRRIAY